jgi:succinate dehydrogenase/fumarate reductase flavoprotein subunit
MMTRRDFLKAAGVSVAALSAAKLFGGFAENVAVAAGEDMPLSRTGADVLVIGGGYAGAFAAVTARAKGLDVVLVDKGTVGRSGMTPWANGFNVFDEAKGDDRDQMIAAVAASSEYVNNRDWLDAQFDDSKARWEDLVAWGILDPKLRHPHLALRDKLVESGVRLLERTTVTDLLTKDGAVVGAIGFSLDDEETVAVVAKATVLCAGAGSYKASGFPIQGLTFDGDAMAYRAGATISGKEFTDFHFTSAAHPADCWAQWEPMWVSGMSQTHGAQGGGMLLSQAFSVHAGEKVSTGPPGGGPPGGGGASSGGGSSGTGGGPPAGGGPPGEGAGGASGGPPGMSSGPQVLGAATGLGIHKAEGVWPADLTGASGVPGLWAAGDALASMLCGASYAGVGFSSSGSAVQGARAGEAAAAFAAAAGTPALSAAALAEARGAMLAPRTRESGFSPNWVLQLLQNTMFPYYVLYVKKPSRLQPALEQVMFLQEHMVPLLVASDVHELKLAHETASMLLNAEMKLRASLFRKESRGTHYREDHPARDDKNWLAWVLLQRGADGGMDLRKKEVPKAWRPDTSTSYTERYSQRFPGELAFLGLE